MDQEEEHQEGSDDNPKPISKLGIILIIVCLCVVGIVSYLLHKRASTPSQPQIVTATGAAPAVVTAPPKLKKHHVCFVKRRGKLGPRRRVIPCPVIRHHHHH
jgi:hypothetical protein